MLGVTSRYLVNVAHVVSMCYMLRSRSIQLQYRSAAQKAARGTSMCISMELS